MCEISAQTENGEIVFAPSNIKRTSPGEIFVDITATTAIAIKATGQIDAGGYDTPKRNTLANKGV